MTSFLFYDIETTGLNAAFDQILTFAAIRTDTNLNEIERYSVTIQMRPDIVPSPGAFITHRLMPEELAEGVCEYEAAREIHAIVNVSGTISIGYNNLGFDDEFLRFTFYRNLLDPYSHQYANGCYRIDLLPIATIYRIFKPGIINWPTTDTGKSSLKLELISNANQFMTSGRSHNAMADVEATLQLARCLIREDQVWSYCLCFFDKNWDRTRIDKMLNQPSDADYPVALMVSHRLGADSTYMVPVIGIGRSYHYKNQSLWIRLDRDIIPNSKIINPNELMVIRKKDGEIGVVLPHLPRYWDRLSDEQKSFAENNLSSIYESEENHSLFKRIIEYHREFKYEQVLEADLDSLLYQSPFFTNAEKQEMGRFHRNSFAEKIAMVETIQSSRVKAMAIRIIFRNFFNKDTLSISIINNQKDNIKNGFNKQIFNLILKDYESYMERVRYSSIDPDFNTKKIIGFKRDERLVPTKAIDEVINIRRDIALDDEQNKILDWLEKYLLSI
ncbi:MAG: exodeoxyribonuclease I [Desulfamplus sp.]|nr:exodeoxyribonuclease I [Desulfamplus sp.]